MFTVKLNHATKHPASCNCSSSYGVAEEHSVYSIVLVEADEVKIHQLRNNELYEVSCKRGDSWSAAFYVANQFKPRPSGFADEVDFYYGAYVENAAGSTTEAVRFRYEE